VTVKAAGSRKEEATHGKADKKRKRNH